jgi:catechol 2,3-dioxygenase-like lactoylglutathione lyase family enzyme
MNPVIGLDHCIIAVHKLEKAREIYEKLGFTAAPLGDHVNRATANYCLMFQDTYLELLGINQPEYPDGGLQQKLKSRGEGLHRLALGTSDADAVKAKIEALGVRTEGPTDLARPSKEPDGIVRFRNLFLEPEDLAGMPIFICGHKTPELMRNARLIDHPNGAIRFAGITGLVSDPAATAQALAKLFGTASITETKFGAELDTGRGFIRLTTDENIYMAHRNLDAHPATERPIWHVLSIGVNDLGETEKYLKQAKISYANTGSALRINRNNACGLVLEFIS